MKLKSKLLLALLATSSAAFAQTAPTAPEVTYNVGVVSQYRYRGLAQTKGRPALQGGIDYANKDGYYLGAWASQIQWIKDASQTNNTYSGNTELDLYGGYKFKSSGIDFDIGFLRYQYIGNNYGTRAAAGNTQYSDANTNELYGAATLGAFTFKISNSMTDLFGYVGTKYSDYYDLTANFDMGAGITLTPHIGRQVVASRSDLSYTDTSLTVAKDIGNGLTLSAAAISTNASSSLFNSNSTSYATGKPAVVLGLKYGF